MNDALEVVAIVVLCIFAVTNILLWGQLTILLHGVLSERREEEAALADEATSQGE